MPKQEQNDETPMGDTPKDETSEGETPRKRGGGPPLGSQNAFRHGLVAGKLPTDLAFVENKTNAFRRLIEKQVIDLKGEINLNDACSINSASKWERHGQLALAWLRELQEQDAPLSERLRFSEAASKASDNRDRNIASLRLDVKPEPISLADYIIETSRDK